jgi:ribosomal subunit interface protein
MKHNIEYKNFEATDGLRSLIDRLIAKLEKRAKNFSPDVVFLRTMIEENQTRSLHHVSLTLDVPGKTLATKEERYDLEATLKDAFAEIERQLKEYKSRLRREHLWKRLAKREEIREMKAVAASEEQRTRETFFALVSPQLKKLNHFIRHVIRYSESTGELVPGELDAEDVTDAALVRAYREFLRGYPQQEIRSWLIRLAMDVLDAEVSVLKQDHEMLHLEEDIPETPPALEVSTLGEEIFDFYQPDEDLKFEDIVYDMEAPTPEEQVENKELRRIVRGLLAQMPDEWRRAVVLRGLRGRTEKQVAEAFGKSEEEVGRILERARESLRQKLKDFGYDFKRVA